MAYLILESESPRRNRAIQQPADRLEGIRSLNPGPDLGFEVTKEKKYALRV